MGRLPKIRVSYYNDAQYMMRLMHALQLDTSRPEEWRKARIRELQEMAQEFLKAPEPKAVKGKAA